VKDLNGQNIEVIVKTDKGTIKEINQDNFLIKVGRISRGDIGLFVICDGLGGLSKGEIASKFMVTALQRWWNTRLNQILTSSIKDEDILRELNKALLEGNSQIINFGRENDIKLGTTCSMILILKEKFYICHIGDSRIYSIDNTINQLTKDHTYYNKLIEEGEIEKSKTVNKSILTQCIGVKEAIKPVYLVGKLKKEAFFLLCSDGFYRNMSEGDFYRMKYEIEETSDYGYMGEICSKYVDFVKQKGEKDNISVILVKYKMGGNDRV
jgi:PPM family protein phosphatase